MSFSCPLIIDVCLLFGGWYNPLYWLVQFRGYISVTAILFVYLKCASLVHELKWKYRVAKMPARVKATVLDR